ncbi:MAG: sugar phosphate nucleotidyltransferase [Lentisphaeria bacterium]|nr:sugar phosphate nucleotidyltransferase [Lentisphaeria bacterium]
MSVSVGSKPVSPSPALVVLAAGMGSRYGGLKQVDPVGPSGEIIIDYSIYDALKAGFRKVVFVIRRDIESDFRAAIGSRYEGICDVRYVFQELDTLPGGFSVPEDRRKPWGTGHAALVAAAAVNEPFAVINADDFYGRRAFQSLAEFLRTTSADSADIALVGFILRNTLSRHGTVSRGVCERSSAGTLEKITELTSIGFDGEKIISTDDSGQRSELTGHELVSMNMWGFTPVFFDHLARRFSAFLDRFGQELTSEFYLPAAVDHMIQTKQAQVTILRSDDQWYGVTNRADKAHVMAGLQALIDAGVYHSPLKPM